MALDTPVAFFIFRRPDLTQQVFNAIAQAKPRKLFIIADGPRNEHERYLRDKAISIVSNITWDCEVFTDYSDENMRSPWRISSGIDWVFSHVEEAIILEDDCLPTQSFFNFCQSLLEHYRDDKRIMHISGNNFQIDNGIPKYSYFFSKYTHNWGWATWRRAWNHFELRIPLWNEFKESQRLRDVCSDPYEQEFWLEIFDKIYDGRSVHWDGAWLFTCWQQAGLSILPQTNLVSNIGFRSDAEHNTSEKSPISNLPTSDIWTISHPPFVVRNDQADSFTFDYVFGGKKMKEHTKKLEIELSTTREKLNESQRQVKAVFRQKEKLIEQIENKEKNQERMKEKLNKLRVLLKDTRKAKTKDRKKLLNQIDELSKQIANMESSYFWRLRSFFRRILKALRLDAR
jgi:hypothetical protein